eukprot:4136941-Amphidinium_carterae.1
MIGYRLAYHKADLGNTVAWIGTSFTFNQDTISVTLKPEMLQEISEAIDRMLAVNMVSVRELRKFVGKCSHAAGILAAWRPFLASLWAAVA